ncbi:DNA repair protein RadC [Candidatus Peregrinibacteria bacterium]|nr:DNA repair protein RadC [Candidatus Peregrinibacteria bacterium]
MLPREKIIKHGVEKLLDKELIALVIGHGSRRENVFNMSERITMLYDQEELANQKSVNKLKKSFDLNAGQASKLIACYELGRRYFLKKGNFKQIQTTKDIFDYLKNMQYLKKEYVRGIYLNTRYKIIHDEIISIGTLESNMFYPRDLIKPAIEHDAAFILLAHNHPSGDAGPSLADYKVTNDVKKACNLIRIPLVDHVIIGNESFFSFSKDKKKIM